MRKAEEFLEEKIERAYDTMSLLKKPEDKAYWRGRYVGLQEALNIVRGGKFFTDSGEFKVEPFQANI